MGGFKMSKILSVRPNQHIMSLLFEIQKHLPDTSRTEIINLAIAKSINKNIDWKTVSKQSYKIYQNLEMPEFMQIKTEKDRYDSIYTEILYSFKEQSLKRVTAPYLIKLALINYLSSLEHEPKEIDILYPVKVKLKEWFVYDENKPKCSYQGNTIVHDIYRALNDSDCQLANGNLMADTIFPLWTPLKMSLQSSQSYPYKLQGNKFYPYKLDSFISNSGNIINFLTDIHENLEIYLPRNEWESLYEFAALSLTRANVMILPHRDMQTRGIVEYNNGNRETIEPFYEQMPRTLFECFDDGEFQNRTKGRNFFKSNADAINWIREEKLESFFDGEVKKENIKPLIKKVGTNEVCWLKEKEEIDEMLYNFINILKSRGIEFDI